MGTLTPDEQAAIAASIAALKAELDVLDGFIQQGASVLDIIHVLKVANLASALIVQVTVGVTS